MAPKLFSNDFSDAGSLGFVLAAFTQVVPLACLRIAMTAAATQVRRFHYEAGIKKRVILFAETDGNRAAAHAFGVPETCVRDWRKLKKRERIANALDGTEDEMLWSAESDKELSESDEEVDE